MDVYFIAIPFILKGWRPDILNPNDRRILIWMHSENNRLFAGYLPIQGFHGLLFVSVRPQIGKLGRD